MFLTSFNNLRKRIFFYRDLFVCSSLHFRDPLMMTMWIRGWKRIWIMNKKHTILMMVGKVVEGNDLVVP